MCNQHCVRALIFINILFVVVQLDKRWRTNSLHEKKQQLQEQYAQLATRHERLSRELTWITHPEVIRQYALRKLGMQEIDQNQLAPAPGQQQQS